MAVTPQIWTFSIGGISLSRFELPQEFDVGVEGHVAVHRYINEQGASATVVHGLGSYPIPTEWKGRLRGATALKRHSQLQNLVATQVVTPLVYGPLLFDVMVKSYTGTVRHQLMVDYHISMVVVKERNGSLPIPAAAQSFDVGTQSFFDTAQQSYTTLVAQDPALPAAITTSFGNLSSAVTAAYPLKLATLAQITSLVALSAGLNSQLSAYIQPLQNNAVVEADLAKLDAALQLDAAIQLFYINLRQLLGLGATTPTVSLRRGNLFTLAATYYPNTDTATAAALIAQANGLDDFFIRTPKTLVLPPILS